MFELMTEMEVEVALALLFRRHIVEKRRKARTMKRRRDRAKRLRVFAAKQARERMLFAIILSAACTFTLMKPSKVLWSKERSGIWWEETVLKAFVDKDWIENFRMSRSTFMYLCNEIREEIQKNDTVMRKACSVEKRVGISLWFLSCGSDYRTIGHLFGVSKSLVSLVVREFCHAVRKVLLPKYIKFPEGDDLKKVVDGFKHKYGFPQCVGAIDGSHIPIVSPQQYAADYYNRKGWHSIILQGTVDHLGLFTDVYVGWPGRVHDARVFTNSAIYQKCHGGNLLPDWGVNFNSVNVPLVFLGDPAYPLQSWLMKPFINNGHLSDGQKKFNYRLSHARVIVEHVYGRLKGRWRCLLKRLDISINQVPELVASCCVLHNICEIHGDSFNDDWLHDVQGNNNNNNLSSRNTHMICSDGENVRNALMAYFEQL